jgi:hypothetical protein
MMDVAIFGPWSSPTPLYIQVLRGTNVVFMQRGVEPTWSSYNVVKEQQARDVPNRDREPWTVNYEGWVVDVIQGDREPGST